jgi:hypothetical protein
MYRDFIEIEKITLSIKRLIWYLRLAKFHRNSLSSFVDGHAVEDINLPIRPNT